MIRVLSPSTRPDWQLITAGTVLLCAFLVPAVILMSGQGEPAFNRADTQWQAYIFTLQSPAGDAVNAFLNWAGYAGMLFFHVVLVTVLFIWRRPKAAIFSSTSGLTALALTQLAKAVVGRDRPEGARVLTDTGSYPSGHVSATTAFLVILSLLMGRAWMKVLAAIGIVAMMVSRTYLLAHWLSDVLGGACLAAGTVLLFWVAFRKACIKENAEADGMTIWQAKALQRRQAGEQPE
ncbi:phosphatase PAP2 family protein [Paenarthrobacter sp. NCHU4564]|uniref:phosphatase PAP2 family protein n=1 Tax=Paenarthrobacter sp. NCHU4564 TaxID=3451353 RepID=UPI003F993BA8